MSKLMSLRSFVRKFNSKTVYVDTRFQRREVWDLYNKRAYLHSLSKNWVRHQNIVVADVAECLAYSQLIDPADNNSYEYFTEILSQGYKYISLDGQNRSKTLEELRNNMLRYTGPICDADGETVIINNDTLSEMPQRVNDLILKGDLISVEVVEEITREELHQFFRSYNAGCPLSKQELRHAEPTPLSPWIEDVAQRYMRDGTAARLHAPKDIKRMKNNELIVKMVMALTRNVGPHDTGLKPPFNLNSKDLDNFYRIGNDSPDLINSPYDQTEQARALDIVGTAMRVFKAQDMHTSPGDYIEKTEFWAVLIGCEYVYDQGLSIGDLRSFYRHLCVINARLSDTAKVQYGQDEVTANQNGTTPPSVEDYYHRWVNLPHQSGQRLRRQKALTGELAISVNRFKLTLK